MTARRHPRICDCGTNHLSSALGAKIKLKIFTESMMFAGAMGSKSLLCSNTNFRNLSLRVRVSRLSDLVRVDFWEIGVHISGVGWLALLWLWSLSFQACSMNEGAGEEPCLSISLGPNLNLNIQGTTPLQLSWQTHGEWHVPGEQGNGGLWINLTDCIINVTVSSQYTATHTSAKH
jgi:hypothetical protein